jgi:hypothetical protein
MLALHERLVTEHAPLGRVVPIDALALLIWCGRTHRPVA